MRELTRVAAVDIGTNTVRLLVCDHDLNEIERLQTITRLGKGVDASRTLDPDAIRRTVDATASFVDRARALGAEHIRLAGTSALRDATNAADFSITLRRATGLEVEILDGRTEGRCAYRGATSWLGEGRFVVCDIGGGSTELITADGEVSIDVGSVRVRERCLRSDPPSDEEEDEARHVVVRAVVEGVEALELPGDERLVGVAGTITTVAALALGLTAYASERIHGACMTRAAVDEWSRRLLTMTADEVRSLGPVEAGRADVLAAGALILSAVMSALGTEDVLVSERDILDGLVVDLVR